MIWISATGSMGGAYLELLCNQQDLKDTKSAWGSKGMLDEEDRPPEFYEVHYREGFFGDWIELQRGDKLKGIVKLVDEVKFSRTEFDIRRECLLDNNLIAGFTHCIEDSKLDDYAKENGDIILQVAPGPYIVHFVKRESVYTGNDIVLSTLTLFTFFWFVS
jgi:hypothetical protein